MIQDFDMAGEMEPWRAPGLIDTPIIRDVLPPRFTPHYLWKSKTGELKADKGLAAVADFVKQGVCKENYQTKPLQRQQ